MRSGIEDRSKKLLKGETTSTRKHRFETFNQRIAKLKIDPIRRRHHNEVAEHDVQETSSFLKVSLDRWKDLNLSETFTSYTREIEPLGSSLPQILHNNQRIFDTLIFYIEKRDALSLEPLLDLLSCFAHDIGVRFEDHFSRAVTLVASLAARHGDVEVIEWSFTCLAWLFKYLSRLLVPDLRPVFSIMAPLLGKEPQKLHTTRFAAEAMSFLIRKAATIYAKNPSPLKIIVSAVRDDITALRNSDPKDTRIKLYQRGLMTLFFDSIKGVDRELFSGGHHIYGNMVENVFAYNSPQPVAFEDIVRGVTVALIHQSDAESFEPILSIIIKQSQRTYASLSNQAVATSGRLLFIVSTARKGSRIRDWKPVLGAVIDLLDIVDPPDEEAVVEVYKAAAVVLQSSPLDLLLPKFRVAMERIASDPLEHKFLSFCMFFSALGRERFQNLMMPYFSRYVIHKWQSRELELCLAIPKVIEERSESLLACPATWQLHMVDQFDVLDNEEQIARCNSYLALMRHLRITSEGISHIMDLISDKVYENMQEAPIPTPRTLFTLGTGLKWLLDKSAEHGITNPERWSSIGRLANLYGSFPPFVDAVFLLVGKYGVRLGDVDTMANMLVENLHSSSHLLRARSLRLINELYAQKCGRYADILVTATRIEDSPLDLQSARAISMQTRRLASQYEAISSDEWLRKAIPHFCFGMLTYRLSQAWEDAISALKQICEAKSGEEVTAAIAFDWLQQADAVNEDEGELEQNQPPRGSLTEFECINLIQVESKMSNDAMDVVKAGEKLRRQSKAAHELPPLTIPNPQALALRVLAAIPQVAEKRSRQLTPIFLSWATEKTDLDVPPSEDDPEPTTSRFKRKDQKAMLDIYGSFQNPKVLYRSSEVFLALQRLLANGDVSIQRSALNATLTWKLDELQPYRENLLNLLDEARFREEISTFLDVDKQNTAIQEDHRSTLMPVILRLLYGRMVAGTGKTQIVKRKAVLQAISRLDDTSLRDFTDIMLGPLSSEELIKNSQLNQELLTRELISTRKQLGLVNMMKNMLEILGGRLEPVCRSLTDALLYCAFKVACQLDSRVQVSDEASEKGMQVSLLKDIRQGGFQCLNLLFQHCPVENLQHYVPAIFSHLLTPRLEKLPIETAQSVSGLLQLFSTWASSQSTLTLLVDYDATTIKAVVNCLLVPSAKDEVRIFILDRILRTMIQVSSSGSSNTGEAAKSQVLVHKVLRPNTEAMLEGAGSLLRKSPSKELMESTIQLISALAPLVETSSHAINLLEICSFLLDQPLHRVNPRTKGELLQVVQNFVPLVDLELPLDLQQRIYRSVSSLFGYFKDRLNRTRLSGVLTVLAERDSELREVARLCIGLNRFSSSKLDEPDFDERLKAFNEINESRYQAFTVKQWRPILFNMLYYVRDPEELMIRSNASFTLRRFVETKIVNTDEVKDESDNLTESILLPALRNGVSESSELVRAEFLNIMAHLIRNNSDYRDISDMQVLLVNDDEEASFFSNILHIQQHRRMRALRRLAAVAKQRTFRSTNVAHFFLPLIEHFIFDKAEGETAHNLSAETVTTIGALAASLEWPQYRAMFRRYGGYIKSKPDLEKTVMKLLGVIIDTLSGAMKDNSRSTNSLEPDAVINQSQMACEYQDKGILAKSMPRSEKLTDDLTNNMLPSLEMYLHEKDESTVSLRVPVAVSVVKLLKLLPQQIFAQRLPPVLIDVCHILRSRAQEARDLTRKTLVEISTLVGPLYFGFILKELRSSLARGYQLHVLSFTMHSILVTTSSFFKPGDLDYCLPQIIAIIMDDIFGATGQEKDAEEYISKMKEVKSSKSNDSMELIARTATIEHLAQLIRPLQALLDEKLDLRMVKKIDELLRRIGVGLLHNEAVKDQKTLVFCHEVIQEVYKREQAPNDMPKKEDYRTTRYLINCKGAKKTGFRGNTSSYNYKLIRFALDVLRSVLQKYDILQTPANLSGFIPIIGDAIVQSNEEIQAPALRLLTTIIKIPLKSIDDNAAIYVAECVRIIKGSTSTNVELAQAALKLVSAILRERRNVEIRETDIAYLLKRLIPDLEEPEKQGVAFNFLKAVMTRKIQITEVYEVLDTVAVITITNQTRTARDMARGAYFQFIMEYPQHKKRFSQQLEFLVKNLEYKHQEGRQSVMEVVNLLMNKVGEDMVQDILSTFFVPLVMKVVNDESNQCREMAGTLLKKLFERADTERTQSLLTLLRQWLSQSDELLLRVSLQIYGIYLDMNGLKGETEVPFVLERISKILKSNLKIPLEADWELLYFALQTMAKLCALFPANAFTTSSASTWSSMRQCLSFPHAWVKLASARLLGTYFADFARTTADQAALTLPLKGSGGLVLSEPEIIETTLSSLGLLCVPAVSEDLANQSVRNLVFLGKIMAQTSMSWPTRYPVPETEDRTENRSSEEYDDEDVDSEDESSTSTTKPAIGHLIHYASRILRRGPLTIQPASLRPLLASLQLLGALTAALDPSTIRPQLPTLLLPLHNLTDPQIPHPTSANPAFTDSYRTLVAHAAELMGLVQKKVGVQEYVGVMAGVREGVRGRREGRRGKRRIEALGHPDRVGRIKKRKGERARERRKEKSEGMRGLRRGW